MSKFRLLMLTSLVVVLAACGGQAPAATPTAVKTAAPTAVKAAPTAVAPTAVVPTKPSAPAAPPKLDPAGACKASPGLPQVPNFPVTLPTDQSKGSDKAPAVLYEYSDFQ